jgi:ABC-type Mn2+/Zn2+ transport system permease subunit
MVSFWEILSPSFLLFPALLGSAILALVCPLVGAHLMLRRRVFLGLTLPQIAACGVAFTFWVYHATGFAHGSGGERLLATAGSLLFTLAGMGLLAYLDRHATGSPEGRLAAAYALTHGMASSRPSSISATAPAISSRSCRGWMRGVSGSAPDCASLHPGYPLNPHA